MTSNELRALLANALALLWSRTTSGDPHYLREVRSGTSSVAFCGDIDDVKAHAAAALIVAAVNEFPALFNLRRKQDEDLKTLSDAICI